MDNQKVGSWLLRIGLSYTFLYAAINSLLNPNDWIWYIPPWVTQIFPGEPLLMAHAIAEIILSIWLISGKKLFWVGVISGLDLLMITVLNLGISDIVFRDVGLLLAAFSLSFYHINDR